MAVVEKYCPMRVRVEISNIADTIDVHYHPRLRLYLQPQIPLQVYYDNSIERWTFTKTEHSS